MAIFGMGGRVQDLLAECVQLQKETGVTIRVAAICDDHAEESYDFYINNRLPQELRAEYARLFEQNASIPIQKKASSPFYMTITRRR